MTKHFEIGKQYRVADINKGDGGLKLALAYKILGFPADGIFTCHSIGKAPGGSAAGTVVACSHTQGIWHHDVDDSVLDIPIAFDEDLEAGVFEEVADASRTIN